MVWHSLLICNNPIRDFAHRACYPNSTMLLYRIVRLIDASFPYFMAALVIFEFCAAFVLMFIFPPGSLGLIFIGLLTIATASVGSKILGKLERSFAASVNHNKPSPHHLERDQEHDYSEVNVFIDDRSGPSRA